jgi:hypothetical protein
MLLFNVFIKKVTWPNILYNVNLACFHAKLWNVLLFFYGGRRARLRESTEAFKIENNYFKDY